MSEHKTLIKVAALVTAVFAVSCGSSGGGPPRPGSDREIACPTSGNKLEYSAKFTPGVARSPTDSLYVTFTGIRPSADEVGAVLQACINATARAVRVDYEMLATAWFNQEGPLALPDGSANLTYDPKNGTIRTFAQRAAAVPKAPVARPRHSIEVHNQKTPVPPNASMVTVDVIFEKPPNTAEIMKILVAELTTVVNQQKPKVNTVAFPRSGPVGTEGTRPQLRATNGTLLVAHFDAKTGEIRDHDRRVVTTIR